jgi:isopenicillin-N epimerase
MQKSLPEYDPMIKHWMLDREVVYLNHGSFGATPVKILERQTEYRQMLEREPVDFFVNQWPVLMDHSKRKLAEFVHADPDDMVFVQNSTTGVNQILTSFPYKSGDEWLVSSHAYGACMEAIKHFCSRNRIALKIAEIPFPVQNDDQILDAIEKEITERTSLALIDHVSSATGMIFPVAKIVDLLRVRGVKSLVDGAHAPGMLALDLCKLDPDFYVANCHKWICAPKGSAFMYVKASLKGQIKPLIISHFNDTDIHGSSHWANQFMWDGTHDFSAYLCVGDTLDYIGNLHEDGWEGVMNSNHGLVWKAGKIISEKLGFELPLKEHFIGSILTMPMPDGEEGFPKFNETPPLKKLLYDKYRIQVPVFMFPKAPRQWLRISSQLYNYIGQYEYLANCLSVEIK